MSIEYIDDLRQTVEHAERALLQLSEKASSSKPAPDKWSPKEIIGHLIDSASNNHQRFIRAQFQDDLIFPGYDQDAWVAAQRYRDASWPELVAFWRAYNLHLARVMELTAESVRMRPRHSHNLHRIAHNPIPEEEPVSLDYFMRDYVDHLKHHLRQILPE